jgi:adenine deaminase
LITIGFHLPEKSHCFKKEMELKIEGFIPDFLAEDFFAARMTIENGQIKSIEKLVAPPRKLPFILPGFIDSHVHIESSMLVPSEFARLAVVHGTVATISDPHEIANVCGLDGVEYMLNNGKQVPFKFYFGAPSCVPATHFETAGANLDGASVKTLLKKPEIKYLSEMMNFPGVLGKDPEVLEKIKTAKDLHKPIDGHAPGLRGQVAQTYIEAGITTDHECFTREEALDKLQRGMKIIIREGSAAKNFEALIELLEAYPDQMMFCSDDKHPDSLVEGHINQLCARATARGINIFKILKAACLNPVHHYKLPVGLLKIGDPADFVIVEDLSEFRVKQTFIDGVLVAENKKSNIKSIKSELINHFNIRPIKLIDLEFLPQTPIPENIQVIKALDGQLITNKIEIASDLLIDAQGRLNSNLEKDILKIVVVNRYKQAPVAKAFITNFGLNQGAIASSVAHDSHNIVALGVDDQSLLDAINLIIENQGGISFCIHDLNRSRKHLNMIVKLPVGGLMSTLDGYEIARQYSEIDQASKSAGCTLASPFMTLSFMALLVIPHLKLSDLGLFDGDRFCFV